MKPNRNQTWLGLVLIALTVAVALWQNPGPWRARLGAGEIEHYVAALQRLPLPPAERDALIAAAREFMAHDDGRPVQMLNLMRYYPELQRYEGAPPFDGTPEASNARYEASVMRLLLAQGGYPLYAGTVAEHNVIGREPELDDWSRVLVVRYPSRRAFMDLLSDPAYAPAMPYKLMALKLVLTPMRAELVVPPLHWLVGVVCLILFLSVGWLRAARRNRR